MKTNKSILFLLCCMLMACTPSNNVNFTWSPAEPRAGQTITFTNTSESGSEWSWSFGDNATSTGKNPTHAYKRAGIYEVTLRVDGRRAWTHTEYVQVFDTVPTITCSDTGRDSTGVLDIFASYTFTASVYNPYSHTMRYAWEVDPDQVALYPDSMTNSRITLRVAYPMDSFRIGLTVTDTRVDSMYHTVRSFVVRDSASRAVLYRLSDGKTLFQRFYSVAPTYYEQLRETSNASILSLMNSTQDTSATYGNSIYTRSQISSLVGESVAGFCIRDARIYYRTDSALKVIRMDGTYKWLILSDPPHFVTCDAVRALLYFSTDHGVYTLPLIQSPNNRFDSSKLLRINSRSDVRKIAISTESYLLNDL